MYKYFSLSKSTSKIKSPKTLYILIELFSKMIQHKHFIVGNSTFSLLAAALSEQDDSITIIASPWFRHKDKKNLSKENWIQIENK